MENSKIEWTDHTVNLWWGCAKVHTGCKNCYAENLSENRMKNNLWGPNAKRRFIKSSFVDLDRYQKDAYRQTKKLKIFVGSMMDIFEDSKLLEKEFIFPNLPHTIINTSQLRNLLFTKITNGHYPNLIFFFLTKRPESIQENIPIIWHDFPPKNVWFGNSISDQTTADELVPHLLSLDFANLFISVEPQVGPIDLTKIQGDFSTSELCKINALNGDQSDMGRPCAPTNSIKWVIQGGESGSKKRDFDINWATKMQQQCKNHSVPYFFKQIDKVHPIPAENLVREFPNF